MGTRPVASPPIVRRCGALAAAVLTVAGLLSTAGVAGAEPQPTVGQAQAKLDKLLKQENVLIQRYDQVQENLKSARQRLALIKEEVGREQVQFRGEQARIAQIAAVAYENGTLDSTAAMLTSDNPQQLLSQSAILAHLSSNSRIQLSQFIATARQLNGAEQSARRTTDAIGKLKAQLTAQRAVLKKLIAKQEALVNSLSPPPPTGGGGGGGGGGGHYHGPTKTQAQKAVAYAYGALGCPYVYGATGPCSSGYDCSGLTQAAWAYAGVSIPRTSYDQAGLPAVSRSDLQPGDILEFAGDSHVGIYVGGGYLIDAPMPGQNVEKISMSSAWYAANYDGAVRP